MSGACFPCVKGGLRGGHSGGEVFANVGGMCVAAIAYALRPTTADRKVVVGEVVVDRHILRLPLGSAGKVNGNRQRAKAIFRPVLVYEVQEPVLFGIDAGVCGTGTRCVAGSCEIDAEANHDGK